MLSRNEVIRIYNLLDKENGVPSLTKHNLELVNKEYFANFERNLSEVRNCNKGASRRDAKNAVTELIKNLPIRFVRYISVENLADYISRSDELWNSIENTSNITEASVFVNNFARIAAENGGRREYSLCSAICRYFVEIFQSKYNFPFYNRPVRSVLSQYINYRYNPKGDVYGDFAVAIDRLSQQTGLNYVELDHILWIFGRAMSIQNADN